MLLDCQLLEEKSVSIFPYQDPQNYAESFELLREEKQCINTKDNLVSSYEFKIIFEKEQALSKHYAHTIFPLSSKKPQIVLRSLM